MTFFNRYRTYIFLSVIIHIMLVAAMFIGSWFKPDPKSGKKNMVQAIVIDPAAIERQAESARARRSEAQKLEQEKNQQEQQKIEQEKIRQQQLQQEREQKLAQEQAEKEKRAEIQRKAIEEEQKKKEELERQKLAEEEKRQQEIKLAKEKAEQQKVAEEKKKAEEAAAAAAAKSNNSEIDDLFSTIDTNDTAKPIPNAPVTGRSDPGSAKEKYDVSLLDQYKNLYEKLIKQKIRNSNSYAGKTCRVNFKLSPVGRKGIVRSTTKLSGDDRLCQATLNAINQIKEFDIPEDKQVVQQLLNNNVTVKL